MLSRSSCGFDLSPGRSDSRREEGRRRTVHSLPSSFFPLPSSLFTILPVTHSPEGSVRLPSKPLAQELCLQRVPANARRAGGDGVSASTDAQQHRDRFVQQLKTPLP